MQGLSIAPIYCRIISQVPGHFTGRLPKSISLFSNQLVSSEVNLPISCPRNINPAVSDLDPREGKMIGVSLFSTW